MAPHTDDRRRAGARARGGGAACRLERSRQARHRSPGVPRALLVRRRAGPGTAGRAHALARRAARACGAVRARHDRAARPVLLRPRPRVLERRVLRRLSDRARPGGGARPRGRLRAAGRAAVADRHRGHRVRGRRRPHASPGRSPPRDRDRRHPRRGHPLGRDHRAQHRVLLAARQGGRGAPAPGPLHAAHGGGLRPRALPGGAADAAGSGAARVVEELAHDPRGGRHERGRLHARASRVSALEGGLRRRRATIVLAGVACVALAR